MTRTVTATEAKNRLGALMSEVLETNEPVIIELRGRPKVALITSERLRRAEELEWNERRRLALESLDKIEAEAAGRNSDLTEEEAMELAVEVVREIRAERAAERRQQAEKVEAHV